MKKSLADTTARATVVSRLQTLAPDSRRQWGRMTPHQAVCHLSDSFRSMMNPVPMTSRSNVFSRTFIRWIAIHSGLRWPHGVRTIPEVDQEIGGTRPVEFMRDRLELEVLIEQFAQRRDATMQPHPIFGRLSTTEWHRWGYLHMDHHLRQFGA
jgi:hypothetical protein